MSRARRQQPPPENVRWRRGNTRLPCAIVKAGWHIILSCMCWPCRNRGECTYQPMSWVYRANHTQSEKLVCVHCTTKFCISDATHNRIHFLTCNALGRKLSPSLFLFGCSFALKCIDLLQFQISIRASVMLAIMFKTLKNNQGFNGLIKK